VLPISTSDNGLDRPAEHGSKVWVLEPELFDVYYKSSAWMFWTTSLCNTFTVVMTYWLLRPGLLSLDEKTGSVLAEDVLSTLPPRLLWYVLAQWSTTYFSIVLCSLIESKWKHHAVDIVMSLFVGGSVVCMLGVYSFLYHPNRSSAYTTSLLWIAASLGLFTAALCMRQTTSLVRLLWRWYRRRTD
jgi:hypothetical protein